MKSGLSHKQMNKRTNTVSKLRTAFFFTIIETESQKNRMSVARIIQLLSLDPKLDMDMGFTVSTLSNTLYKYFQSLPILINCYNSKQMSQMCKWFYLPYDSIRSWLSSCTIRCFFKTTYPVFLTWDLPHNLHSWYYGMHHKCTEECSR